MTTNATRRHRRSRSPFGDSGSTTGVATATLALVSAGALATLGLVTAGEIAGDRPDRLRSPRSVQPPDGVVVAAEDAEQPGGTSGGGEDNPPPTGTGPTFVPFLPFLPPSLGGRTPSGTTSPDNGLAVPEPIAEPIDAPAPDLASVPPAPAPAPVVVLADKRGKSAFSPGHTKPGGTTGRAEGRAVGGTSRDVAAAPRPTLAAAGQPTPSRRETAPGRLRHAEGGRPADPSRGRSVPTAPAVPAPAAQPPAQPAAHEPPGLAKGQDKH